MFTYAYLKGSRLGLLDSKFDTIGRETFDKFVSRFVKTNEDGTISVTDCCAVAGLGGKNKRDGSFDYYIHEPIRDNDPKTIGPFVLSCLELDR
jgi:unsaturated rhamnogalacturonyl hydrolase